MAEEEKEAEATETPAEGEAEAPKKSKKKLIIIIVAVLVLLIGAGAGAYFGGFIGGKHAEGEKTEEEAKAGEGHEGEKHGAPVFYELPEFLVNLNTTSRQASFLKMTISLELASEEDKVALEAKLPRVLDSFNTYLRELRATDLYGSAGIFRLREELLTRVNKAVEPIKVNDILFKQILVQ